MPETPDHAEEVVEMLTIPRLAARVGVSRSLVHRLATNPAEGWPAPTFRPGSSRPEYSVAWFDEYWVARQSRITQGRRTDLQRPQE